MLDWMDYGALGGFVAYLIYDRRVLLASLERNIVANTEATRNLSATVAARFK